MLYQQTPIRFVGTGLRLFGGLKSNKNDLWAFPYLPGAGFSSLLPSSTRNENTARLRLAAPEREGALNLASSVRECLRSPTAPAAHRKAASPRSSYRRTQKSANTDRCLFSNLPPSIGSPAPFRPAHFLRSAAPGAGWAQKTRDGWCWSCERGRRTPIGTIFRGVGV